MGNEKRIKEIATKSMVDTLKKADSLKEDAAILMKQEHYDYLEDKIQRAEKTLGITYHNDCLLSGMRYRWDLAHAAGLTPWICKHLYSYLDDNHIDTALRKITKTS